MRLFLCLINAFVNIYYTHSKRYDLTMKIFLYSPLQVNISSSDEKKIPANLKKSLQIKKNPCESKKIPEFSCVHGGARGLGFILIRRDIFNNPVFFLIG